MLVVDNNYVCVVINDPAVGYSWIFCFVCANSVVSLVTGDLELK